MKPFSCGEATSPSGTRLRRDTGVPATGGDAGPTWAGGGDAGASAGACNATSAGEGGDAGAAACNPTWGGEGGGAGDAAAALLSAIVL